ncbi:unnamed protein product [Bursaphelenchus xylophilus]|uniref:(pine wood nematode) hypothetical protein n=1 Tax=Bursaphelenchus xylophilus TaxID=6326 RepID=A0A1I7S9G6_BURXY|nr:unnamed protein product [Bursaphelenchus xylophilus]CAG9111088.1 unnamed protein product [Bursaphelenchus xylophilus]
MGQLQEAQLFGFFAMRAAGLAAREADAGVGSALFHVLHRYPTLRLRGLLRASGVVGGIGFGTIMTETFVVGPGGMRAKKNGAADGIRTVMEEHSLEFEKRMLQKLVSEVSEGFVNVSTLPKASNKALFFLKASSSKSRLIEANKSRQSQ